MNPLPENVYRLNPDHRRMFDILVKAGWLENVIDHPGDPIKDLKWVRDKEDPSKDGDKRFLTFNVLYSELCRFGTITENDLLMISEFAKHLRKSN